MREKKKPILCAFRISPVLSRAVDMYAARAGVSKSCVFTRAVISFLSDDSAQHQYDEIGDGDDIGLLEKRALFAERVKTGDASKDEFGNLKTLAANAVAARKAAKEI